MVIRNYKHLLTKNKIIAMLHIHDLIRQKEKIGPLVGCPITPQYTSSEAFSLFRDYVEFFSFRSSAKLRLMQVTWTPICTWTPMFCNPYVTNSHVVMGVLKFIANPDLRRERVDSYCSVDSYCFY